MRPAAPDEVLTPGLPGDPAGHRGPASRGVTPERSFERIDDVQSLQAHLQCAIELEHATLPPYLCALYSLDRDRNPVAFEVLLSVFVEEMLHITLAANVLNRSEEHTSELQSQ